MSVNLFENTIFAEVIKIMTYVFFIRERKARLGHRDTEGTHRQKAAM